MCGTRISGLWGWIILVVIVVLVGSVTASGKVIYVDDDASFGGNGQNWENAYNYLQDALADAGSAIKPVEIRVAEGIYRPDETSAIPNGSGDRTTTFHLINGVTIKGGYAGFGEPDPNARDIGLYETILSGDLAGNDTEVDDLEYLLYEQCRAENTYRVVTGSWTDVNAVLDGFTITAANNNRTGYPTGGGAGMYSYEGGASIINCEFRYNAAMDRGGGMLNDNFPYGCDYCIPKIENCTFIYNVARSGGGMYNFKSNPTISNCKFIGNIAENGRGGGMRNLYSHPILTNCLFIRNSAESGGGGMANGESSPALTNCTFSGNLSGGGMYNSNGTPTLTNCILWDNASVEIYGDTPTVTYSDIQGGWPGLGNIDVDPCFVDVNNGDYHLQADSFCINAGDPNYVAAPNEVDLDGKTRVISGRIDIGAYEAPIPAEVRIIPQTINLNSKGKWITCYIWLPEGYDVADIDPNSVFLEDEIQPDQFLASKQEQVAVAIFSRQEVQAILNIGEVELAISGWLTDGTIFEGTDVIKVVQEGGGKLAKIVQAGNPNPADGATNVATNADLSWTASPYATSHNVYFGTSSQPPFVCNQTVATFDPGTMDYETTYYWHIDEVSKWGITTGQLWRFTTLRDPGPGTGPTTGTGTTGWTTGPVTGPGTTGPGTGTTGTGTTGTGPGTGTGTTGPTGPVTGP